ATTTFAPGQTRRPGPFKLPATRGPCARERVNARSTLPRIAARPARWRTAAPTTAAQAERPAPAGLGRQRARRADCRKPRAAPLACPSRADPRPTRAGGEGAHRPRSGGCGPYVAVALSLAGCSDGRRLAFGAARHGRRTIRQHAAARGQGATASAA